MWGQVLHFNDLVSALFLTKVSARKLLHNVSPIFILNLPLVVDLNSTEVGFPMWAAGHWKRALPD